MPRLLTSSQVPVELSVLECDLAEEELFLSYTWERYEGPPIRRTGKGPPYMTLIGGRPRQTTTHPLGFRLGTWLLQESDREEEERDSRRSLGRAQEPSLPESDRRMLQQAVDELATGGTGAHDEVFRNNFPGHEILAMQGCGDLTMNAWNVAFVNDAMRRPDGTDQPSLVCLPDEKLERRTYLALVKWRSRNRVSIEEVRFKRSSAADEANNMVWVRNHGTWLPRGEAIAFAVTNQPVLMEGEVVPVVTTCERFGDLRHLIKMPNLNPRSPLFLGDPGRPRVYFDEEQYSDIWLGEREFLKDERRNLLRAALTGPVVLDLPPGATDERLRGAMELAGYWKADSPSAPLRPAEWRFIKRPALRPLLEIYFLRNCYPWTMIGLSQDDRRLICLAAGGKSGRSGYTLEEAAQEMREAGAWKALLIDEGADVFQKLSNDQGQLIDRVHRGRVRRRLRAVFIIAKPSRQNEERMTAR